MKSLKSILFFCSTLFLGFVSTAQVGNGSSCDQANCSTGGTYPSIVGQPSLGQFGCLYSTPNPYWVAINITEPGNVHLTLTQNGDIDFAAYGPFTSISAGCPITSSTPQVDCSYSASGTEYVDIYNVSPGQVYIILITNYSGNSGNYNLFPQSSNTATFDCNIDFGGTTTSTPSICGQPTGSVSVTPAGGYPPYTYVWNNIPGNPTTPSVSNLPAGTYSVTITSSPDPVTGFTYNPATVSVTVANTNPPIAVTATSTPDICSSGQGSVTATPTSGQAPYTFNWPALGSTNQSVNGVHSGTYLVQVSDDMGCSGTATVVVTDTPASYSSSNTLVSCPAGNDGTATAQMVPELGTLTYQWNDPMAQTTQTAVGLSAGTYNCVITSSVGCSNTVSVTVSEIPGMQADFSTVSDVTCYSKNDGILTVNVIQGTPPYTYSWDRSSSVTHSASDLYVGTHTVTIMDDNGCVITKTETLSEPDPLKVLYITPDTQICPEDDILITASATGGSSAYTFTWSSEGNTLGTGSSITVDPLVTNTQYCVEVTEACGSPKADSCMVVTFPVPIPPMLTPDKYVDCRPGEFFIQNTSPNIGELATTYIDFGNNTNAIIPNGGDTSVVYQLAGSYTLEVVNTSIYGCVYDTILENFLLVTPEPTAKFYLGGNPATIFETTLSAHDLSSNDVVEWEWISPYSQPSSSTLENPKFTFPGGVEGIYPVTLIVTSYHGCTDTFTLDAIVEDVILFFVPNTFTPDGDEFNQTWSVVLKGGDLYGFNLQVYNRWGEVIWETNDPSVGWDGTYNGRPVQQGMYTWKASVKNKNNDGKNEYTGTVNILR